MITGTGRGMSLSERLHVIRVNQLLQDERHPMYGDYDYADRMADRQADADAAVAEMWQKAILARVKQTPEYKALAEREDRIAGLLAHASDIGATYREPLLLQALHHVQAQMDALEDRHGEFYADVAERLADERDERSDPLGSRGLSLSMFVPQYLF